MSVDIVARGLALQARPVAANATTLGSVKAPASVESIQTAGYAQAGVGAGLYVSDALATAALATAHPLFCKQSNGGRFWRLSLENGLNVLQAGVVADDTAWPNAGSPTDNGPAFVAALTYMRAMIQAGAPVLRRVYVPSGRYYLGTSTIDVKFTVTIEGDPSELNSDVGGGLGTRLRWTGTSTDGFRFQGYDTTGTIGQHGVSGEPANDGLWSYNSELRNLVLNGGWAGTTEGEGHGVRLRGTTICRNVIAREWPGDGFYGACSSIAAGGVPFGNCNGSVFENCKAFYCRNGFFFDGGDTNGIVSIGCWEFLNRRYGRWHKKGIGNTILGGVSESNGRHGPIPTTCHFGGNWYYCLPNQETGAAANAPPGATVTVTIASPGVVTWTAHGLANGQQVSLKTTGALPTGLVEWTRYYVVNKTTNTFQLSATSGGAAINTSGSQSGVHSLGVAANNTYWAYLETGDGGIDVPTWSNGMTIRAGGVGRFDGTGEGGVNHGLYTEANQAPMHVEAQYTITGVLARAVHFDGTPYSGWVYTIEDQPTFSKNAKINNNLVVANGLTVGSSTKTTSTNAYLSTSTGTDCVLYGQFSATGKLPYYGMSSNGDLTLSSDGATGYLYRNGSGYVAKWTSAGFFVSLSGGKLGYDTGTGGAVTQTTSRSAGVTLDKACGQITLVSAAGSASWQTFTVNNSVVEAGDVVRVVQKTGTDKYIIHVTAVAAGTFDVTFATTGGTTTEQPVLNFAVLKAVAA